MQFYMIHDCLGGDVGIYGIGIPGLADPCVFDGVNDEDATAAFGGFVQLEIVPQQFVGGLGTGADNRSDAVRDDQLDNRPCGGGEHLVMSRFVGSFVRWYSLEVVISIVSVVWGAKYDKHVALPKTEQVVVLGFSGDRGESSPSRVDGSRHVFGSHGGREVPSETEEDCRWVSED